MAEYMLVLSCQYSLLIGICSMNSQYSWQMLLNRSLMISTILSMDERDSGTSPGAPHL